LEQGEKGLRKTTDEIKKDIFNEWINGASYRETSEKHGVGLGTISRIIDEYRKASPDIDQLRGLHVRLKKNGFTYFDAIRACRYLEYLNSYGIGLSELQQYIKMCQRILSDKNLQDNVMTYAVKLMQLEEKCQKTFEKVVEDFDNIVSETANIKAENEKMKLKNRELEEEAENTTRKIGKLKEEKAQISTQIEKLANAHKLLQKVGLRKLLVLAKLDQDFETLDFSIEEIKKLSKLKQDLINVGIQPDNLKSDITQVQSLSSQITSLRSQVDSLENRRQRLLKANPALQAADEILRTNTIKVLCRSCHDLLPLPLPSKNQQARAILRSGSTIPITCPKCGYRQTFSPLEVAAQIAYTLLR
jgi:RNase P subunit RPR2